MKKVKILFLALVAIVAISSCAGSKNAGSSYNPSTESTKPVIDYNGLVAFTFDHLLELKNSGYGEDSIKRIKFWMSSIPNNLAGFKGLRIEKDGSVTRIKLDDIPKLTFGYITKIEAKNGATYLVLKFVVNEAVYQFSFKSSSAEFVIDRVTGGLVKYGNDYNNFSTENTDPNIVLLFRLNEK